MIENIKTKLKILFMGTPEFAVPSLRALVERGYSIGAVITAPDKPAGRGRRMAPPPVKVLAEEFSIPVLQPEKISHIKDRLSEISPDLAVVAAYGKLLPSWLLELPRYGAVNIHPSLLPRWRGPSPIQYAILAGDEKTGVSIMLLDEQMDHGPILARREFQISNFKFQNGAGKATTAELAPILAKLGAQLLIETMPKWVRREIKPIAQDENKATYSKIIAKEDGRIDWAKGAEEIERQVRALDPWPGTFSFFGKKVLKILTVEECGESDSPHIEGRTPYIGEIFFTTDKKVAVQTGTGHLALKKVQLEGKKAMNVEDFVKGHPNFIETILH